MKILALDRRLLKFALIILPIVVLIIGCSPDALDLVNIEKQDKIITSGKYGEKDINKLIQLYLRAIKSEKRKKTKAKIYLRVSTLFYMINQKDDALINVTKSITQNNKDPNALFLSGLLKEEKGSLKLAYLDYQKVVAINRKYSGIYERMGVVNYRMNILSDAKNNFGKEIKLHPERYYPYVLRGDTYKKLKKYNLSINDYIKAVTILNKMGSCKNNTCFSPAEVDIYLKIGDLYEKKGLYEKAIVTYKNAIKSNPGSPKLYNNLGWLYLTAKDPTIRNNKQAINYAEKANQLSKGSDAEILDTLATIYYKNNKYKAAYAAIVKANKLAPESTGIRIKLEKYKAKVGSV